MINYTNTIHVYVWCISLNVHSPWCCIKSFSKKPKVIKAFLFNLASNCHPKTSCQLIMPCNQPYAVHPCLMYYTTKLASTTICSTHRKRHYYMYFIAVDKERYQCISAICGFACMGLNFLLNTNRYIQNDLFHGHKLKKSISKPRWKFSYACHLVHSLTQKWVQGHSLVGN